MLVFLLRHDLREWAEDIGLAAHGNRSTRGYVSGDDLPDLSCFQPRVRARVSVAAFDFLRLKRARGNASPLDIWGLFPNSGTRMGKHDNRRSKKMRQRVSQKKYKARVKRQKVERRAARGAPVKAPRKPRAAAPAPAKE